MSSGRKIKIRGMNLDKSGTRLTRDLKALDASAQAKAKGAPKVRIGVAKTRASASSRAIIEASAKRRASLMKRLAKR